MPTRLLIGYTLLALTVTFLLTVLLVWRRRRRLEHERRYGRRRLS
ncbi:MAG TPA: hypothetical protein VEC11_12965 [Allosphingosinicella sp.]|nr:hypothetical protein [Allosphingosinicella sp.]